MKEKYLKFANSYGIPFTLIVFIIYVIIDIHNSKWSAIVALPCILFEIPYNWIYKQWIFLFFDIIALICIPYLIYYDN